MLAVTGGVTLWYVSSVTNMRYGKYRLFAEVESLGKNPYNGDAYVFLSKDRQTLKIIRFKNHKRLLYDVTYEKGYKFLQPVYKHIRTEPSGRIEKKVLFVILYPIL